MDLSGFVRPCPNFQSVDSKRFRLGGASSFLSGLSDTRTKGDNGILSRTEGAIEVYSPAVALTFIVNLNARARDLS